MLGRTRKNLTLKEIEEGKQHRENRLTYKQWYRNNWPAKGKLPGGLKRAAHGELKRVWYDLVHIQTLEITRPPGRAEQGKGRASFKDSGRTEGR